MDVQGLTGAGRHRTRAQRLSHVTSNWIGCSELDVQFNYLRKQNPIEFSLGSKRSFIILWATQTPAFSLDFLEYPICSGILATWDKQIGIVSPPSTWDSYHCLSFMGWHWQYSSHGQQQTVESVHPWCRVWRRLAWLLLFLIRSTGWCPDGRSVAMQTPNCQTTLKGTKTLPFLPIWKHLETLVNIRRTSMTTGKYDNKQAPPLCLHSA